MKQRQNTGGLDDLDSDLGTLADLDAPDTDKVQKMKDALRKEEKRQAAISRFNSQDRCIC